MASPALSQSPVAVEPPRSDASALRAVLVRPVTVALDRVSVREAVDALAKSAQVRILYRYSVLAAVQRPVSLRVSNTPLEVALAHVLAGTGMQAVAVTADALTIEPIPALAKVAQGAIQGTVRSAESGQPVRGAKISLDGANPTAESDADGRFLLANILAGSHTVTIKLIGYWKETRTVQIEDGRNTALAISLATSASTLDQVVVTGTVIPTELKAVPNAMTVITAKQIEERGITRIDQLFRGDVPGLFAASYGGIETIDRVLMFSRGSSDMSANNGSPSTPIKTYVDGVELANAKFLNQIDPKSIERIEIIAGPQASTIYGSGAINGVMQIFTKRGTTSRPQVTLSLLSGLLQNNFTSALTPQHDDNVQVSGVEGHYSYNVGASWTHVGRWTPFKQKTDMGGFSGARLQFGGVTADANLRLASTRTSSLGTPFQGQVADAAQGLSVPFTPTSRVQLDEPHTQTLGLAFAYTPMVWWSHELVLGSDLSVWERKQGTVGFSNASDTTLSYFEFRDTRQSLRYATTAKLPISSAVQTVVTVGADQWRLLSTQLSASGVALTGSLASVSLTRQPTHNTGGFIQGQVGIRDALFLTYGLRAEWNPNYGDAVNPNIAPRYGVAYTQEIGSLTAKLRASYGRATKPPTADQKKAVICDYTATDPGSGRYTCTLGNPDLAPSSHQGGEGGMELYFGTRGSLVVTRYNETVNDLVAYVIVDSVQRLDKNPDPYGYCITAPSYCGYGAYMRQGRNLNVGSIRNQGWELQGTTNLGPLMTKGTYSWTKSRMIGITPKYRAGFLATNAYPGYQPGATFSDLAEHTWAITVGYAALANSLALSMNGTGPVFNRNYDVLQRSIVYARLFNARLRAALPTSYRPQLSGSTMADLNGTHRFSTRVEGIVQVHNLSNSYHNDYDPAVASVGRATSVGVRIRL